MKLTKDFLNKLLSYLDRMYFPQVNYYMDDHNCAKIHHTVELFSNGCLEYPKLIRILSENCVESQEKIHEIVSTYVTDFEDYKFKVRTIDKILTPRNCKYGAPMGRSSIIPAKYTLVDTGGRHKHLIDAEGKSHVVFDCALPMSSCGAYSKDSTYWGIGKQMRVRYTKDLNYVHFYRKGEE